MGYNPTGLHPDGGGGARHTVRAVDLLAPPQRALPVPQLNVAPAFLPAGSRNFPVPCS